MRINKNLNIKLLSSKWGKMYYTCFVNLTSAEKKKRKKKKSLKNETEKHIEIALNTI